MDRPREFWIDENCLELQDINCVETTECHVHTENVGGKMIHVVEYMAIEQKDKIIDWLNHYVSDRQYEKIPPEKDFELKEMLAKINQLEKQWQK